MKTDKTKLKNTDECSLKDFNKSKVFWTTDYSRCMIVCFKYYKKHRSKHLAMLLKQLQSLPQKGFVVAS